MRKIFEKVKKFGTALLVLLVLVSVLRGISRLVSSEGRVGEAQEKLEELKKEQELLKYELEQVSSDYYREKQARDKLGLAKEGESIVVLPEEDILRRLSPRRVELEEVEQKEPNWKKWSELFF